MEVLLDALGGEQQTASVHDPLRRPIEAGFALLGDGETAVVEVAQASGLPLVAPEERDPERADTFGPGELIAGGLSGGLWAHGAELRGGAGKRLHLIVGENTLKQGLPAAVASIVEAGDLDEMRQVGSELTRPS